MKNRLSDLNDHLFAQLERLSEEGLTAEQIATEAQRGEAMVAVADQIIKTAALQVKTAELVALHSHKITPYLPVNSAAAAIEAKKS